MSSIRRFFSRTTISCGLGLAILIGILNVPAYCQIRPTLHFGAATPAPPPGTDLSVGVANFNSFLVGANGVFAVSLTNSGATATGATTLTITLPNGIGQTTATSRITGFISPIQDPWTCGKSGQIVTCTNPDPEMPAGATTVFTFTVDVQVAAVPIATVSATVSGGGDTNSANNTGADTISVSSGSAGADLIVNANHADTFIAGDSNLIQVQVLNIGGAATSGSINVNMTLPIGLGSTPIFSTLAAGDGTWSCSRLGATETCTDTAGLLPGADAVFTYRLNIPASAIPNIQVNASVSGGNDSNTANNSSLDTIPVIGVVDLSVRARHSGAFRVGTVGTFTLTVSNFGTADSSGSVTLMDTLPIGVDAASATGSGWSCSITSGVLTCTRADVLSAGSSFPAVTVNFTSGAEGVISAVNTVSISGGGDFYSANNSDSDTLQIIPVTSGPDMLMTLSHIGNFPSAAGIAAYEVHVANVGNGDTTGAISIAIALPANATFLSTVGAGAFSCGAAAGGVACSTSVPFTSGNTLDFTLNLNVAAGLPSSFTATGTVTNAGDVNNSNNSSSDLTLVNTASGSDLTVTITPSTQIFHAGLNGAYTIDVHNNGSTATSGTTTVITELPPGMGETVLGATGSGWTFARSNRTVMLTTTSSIGANLSAIQIVMTASVSPNAPSRVGLHAAVSGGGDINTANDESTASVSVASSGPDVLFSIAHGNPFLTGTIGTYTLSAKNVGSADTTGTITVTDTLPVGLNFAGFGDTGGFACSNASQTVTCSLSSALAIGVTKNINVNVGVNAGAIPFAMNQGASSLASDINTDNDVAVDPTPIRPAVASLTNLAVAVTDSANPADVGTPFTYTITAKNNGTSLIGNNNLTVAIGGAVSVGTITSSIGSCTAPSNGAFTCATGGGAITVGGIWTVTVSVTPLAGASGTTLSATASVFSTGSTDTDLSDNVAAKNTAVNSTGPASDLVIVLSASGSFFQGQVGGTYSLSAVNNGSGTSSGTVTVVDTVSTGQTATAISGTGWACTLATLTCTRNDSLVGGGTSYPTITVTVNIALNAPATVSSNATVSGGNEVNTANDTASASVTVFGPDLVIVLSASGSFFQGQVGGTYSLSAVNNGSGTSSGTVTVVDTVSTGQTATAISGTGWACTLATLTCTRNDSLVGGGTSYPTITVTVNIALNAPATVSSNATVSGGNEVNTANDTASASVTVFGPDLVIVLSASGSFFQGQVGGTYSLSAVNNGSGTSSGTVTVVDTVSTGQTATAISGTGWACTLATLTCTRNDSLVGGGTSYPTITVTVNIALNAPATVSSNATVSGGNEVNTANDTASASVTVFGPDLVIVLSASGSFFQGQVGGTYSLSAVNNGSGTSSGTVTVVDTVSTGQTATAISGTGWACTLATLTCTRNDSLVGGGTSYPTITVTVNIALNAPATVSSNATVSGGNEVNTANDTGSASVSVTQLTADLAVAKSHSGNFTQGQVGANYSITVSNVGQGGTSGTVTVVDTLPIGLTATGISGSGWTCVLGTLSCSRSDSLAGSSAYPVVIVTVNVATNAPATVTNSATVGGGGDTSAANNTALDPTTIVAAGVPDLTIAKSHVGNFAQGQLGATYSITVSNGGAASTSGTVMVVDSLPAGLTATAIAGTGWTCTLGNLTCTRGDALAVAGSYPAITLAVNVDANAPASVTNSATVSGGGETNAANDVATNPTTITTTNPVPVLTSLAPNNVSAGSGAFTLTVNGNNFVGTSVVQWNGSARTTTFVSATQLSAAVTAADVQTANINSVSVLNPAPGGGTSNVLSFTVTTPVPALSTLVPNSAIAGGAALTLTVNGSNFISTSVVQWNNSNRATTFVNATQLTASITAADILTAGTASVKVFTPTVIFSGPQPLGAPAGTTSNTLTFAINAANPVPTLTTISPTSAGAGGAAFTLTLNGTNFISSSVAQWKGSARTTTFVSATQLTAAITAADIAASGTAAITVVNPTPGGGTSNALTFTITDFSVSATTTSQTVTAGQSANFTISTATVGGAFPGSVTFTASGLPTGAAATFSPASVSAGTNTTMTVTTTARGSAQIIVQPFSPNTPMRPMWIIVLVMTLALVSVGVKRFGRISARRMMPVGALVLLLISAGYLSGCAGGFPKVGSNTGTPAGTYPITVTGTSGTDVHTTTVTLIVQ